MGFLPVRNTQQMLTPLSSILFQAKIDWLLDGLNVPKEKARRGNRASNRTHAARGFGVPGDKSAAWLALLQLRINNEVPIAV